ncbi:hypothetical protein TNIN_181391 [Trichonephila inaurata madagascariensis]|uniref:Uncharacterized protein n=1 Tax=Trichonephila inaurata madagascariensis TaxID=2747483 RepID=A0A8X6YS13_9ARAC|nr:hypothetical protein TNIN_181391 [Trichonephila inaurata madagascariensis]
METIRRCHRHASTSLRQMPDHTPEEPLYKSTYRAARDRSNHGLSGLVRPNITYAQVANGFLTQKHPTNGDIRGPDFQHKLRPEKQFPSNR